MTELPFTTVLLPPAILVLSLKVNLSSMSFSIVLNCRTEIGDVDPLRCNINRHILFTVFHIFLMVLVVRICTNIKTFYVR